MGIVLAVGILTSVVTGCEYKEPESVNCQKNNLIHIPPNTFAPDIKSLDLSRNSLKELEWNAFQDYPDLRGLYLDKNKITEVGKRAFSDLTSLQHLDLSNNQIASLLLDTFSSNAQLKTLSLRNNPLQKWLSHHSPFLLSLSLITLDLSHCSLTSIDNKTFQLLPSLERIDLRNNTLFALPSELFDKQQLKALYLSGNRWKSGPDLFQFLQKNKGIVKDSSWMKCWDENGQEIPAVSMTTGSSHSTDLETVSTKSPSISSSSKARSSSTPQSASLSSSKGAIMARTSIASSSKTATIDEIDQGTVSTTSPVALQEDDDPLILNLALSITSIALVFVIVAFIALICRNRISKQNENAQYSPVGK